MSGDEGEQFKQEGALADACSFAVEGAGEVALRAGEGDAVGVFLQGSHPGGTEIKGVTEFFTEVTQALEVCGEGVHGFLWQIALDHASVQIKGFQQRRCR